MDQLRPTDVGPPKVARFAIIIWCVLLLGVFISALPKLSEAQSVVIELRCPKTPLNVTLYEDVLARSVELGVDPTLYAEPKARVSLRQARRTKERSFESGDTILNGLTLSQEGLNTTLSGDLGYLRTCEYPFVARVALSAIDRATNTRLTSSIESLITLTSTGELVRRKAQVVPE